MIMIVIYHDSKRDNQKNSSWNTLEVFVIHMRLGQDQSENPKLAG